VSSPVHNILAIAGTVRMRSGYLHMIELLRGLAAHGCQVTLACSRVADGLASWAMPCPVHTWSEIAGAWPGLRGGEAFEKFARQQKAQIIHIHGTGLGWAAARFLRLVDTPAVFTPHSASSRLGQLRRVQQRAKSVLALSESLREGLQNRGHVPREKLCVVPPGIDVAAYELALPQMDGHVPVVGTVAPFEATRGQACFLEAAKQLLDSGRKAEFVVAGDGPAERALRRKADALGLRKKITFVTRLQNYRDVIAALDIFVRPAVSGGIGHTVIEAMALGKTVVVVAAEGMLEIVDEGRTGLVIPRGDPQALALAVGQILDDPAQARTMGLAARDRIVKEFSLEKLVTSILRTYAEALR